MTQEKKEIGITSEKDEFSDWFTQLIIKSGLADYSSVSGCIVFKPASYQIWEKTKEILDKEFKKIKVQNCYFPLLIPESLLVREAIHLKGFTPEVAWVTQAGDTKLVEKLAIRPTSEAIMYESYSKWIRSWRDLPLKLNQWNNVIRWEFKHPIPFLRTREFLWNEGHHAYSSQQDLEKDKKAILAIYSDFLKDYMALPGLIGKKTNKEKFAGAKDTYTIELILPNGKAIQGPDFHDDGENFAKAYNIKYLDKNEKETYALQATYAITTRMLGVMFAIHSDSKGLIIPPKLAENKIVIIPIYTEKEKAKIIKQAKKISQDLIDFNPILDDREEYKPGWKYSEYELRGIPIRLELGPRDLKASSATLVTRLGEKSIIKLTQLKKQIPKILEKIHFQLYNKANKFLKQSLTTASTMDELKKAIENKKVALVPLCTKQECEDWIKDKTSGAKTLNMPLNQPKLKNKKCVYCNKPASYEVYIGKSY